MYDGNNDDRLVIKGSRFGTGKGYGPERFVPNDTCMNGEEGLLLITGPNMVGNACIEVANCIDGPTGFVQLRRISLVDYIHRLARHTLWRADAGK